MMMNMMMMMMRTMMMTTPPPVLIRTDSTRYDDEGAEDRAKTNEREPRRGKWFLVTTDSSLSLFVSLSIIISQRRRLKAYSSARLVCLWCVGEGGEFVREYVHECVRACVCACVCVYVCV